MAKPRFTLRSSKVFGRFVAGNAVSFLRDGRQAFPAMLDAINQAERQILLEMYWFGSDRTGRRFAEALSKARERGVEVAVIYDAVGSLGTDRKMFSELEQRGVHVLEYNPVVPWRRRFEFSLAHLSTRDHRKILVVDGQIGFTGGLNLADEWLPKDEGGGGWRDDVLRIEGPGVAGLTRCFQRAWRRDKCPPLLLLQPGPVVAQVGQRLVPVRVLGERYYRDRHEIAREYAARLRVAERSVCISNSYFVPDRVVRTAIVGAAKRGVAVKIIVPAHSDVESVKHAGRATYRRLLRAGVRIFEWQTGMFHAKTAVIDGEWCTTGTFNFDYLSLRRNLEVNASVLDREFAAQVEQSFEQDLLLSREVQAHEFEGRPLGSRLVEAIFYRLRKFL